LEDNLKDPIVEFSKFDTDQLIVDREGILAVNPHRFEMMLLDGVLYVDEDRAVGFKDVTDQEFWVRGHFPERPIMPGVLICESAAQLSAYFASTKRLLDSGVVGLGGLESVRFRAPVVPGDKLILMLRRGRVRKNVMFMTEFQAFVNETLVADGLVKGVALQ
jgi:3-hydroxyacyl-[acyl-carrier-protein] dehydratase